MKKIFFAAIALCLTANNVMAIDNEPEEGLSWQAVFGLNISSIKGNAEVDDVPYDMDAKVGVDIGMRGEFVLPNAHGTYISFGVEWTQKGAKQQITRNLEDSPRAFTGKYKINSHYIYIPVHVGFRYNFSEDWGIYGEVGPYFAVGITGRISFDADQEGHDQIPYEFSYKTFKKSDQNYNGCGGLQRFDSGIGFRVGVECQKHYSLNVGCDWGFTDMLRKDFRNNFADHKQELYGKDGYSADKLKNFCLSITLGYRF